MSTKSSNQHPTSLGHSPSQLSAELEEQDAVVRFVGGNPSPEEIAAVTAVVTAAAAETDEASTTGTRRAQNRRARLGLNLRPGLGAWRRTLPFR